MFIGISNSPGNENGGLVAQVDSSGSLTAEHRLDEQGVITMLWDHDTLAMPGTDPTYADGWQFGNLYTRLAAGTWTKHRNMPNVIHGLGACIHKGELYVAVAAHAGDNQTWEARVFRSPDQGQSWSSTYIAYYRVYDVASFNGRLYATVYDWPSFQLFYSADDGSTWHEIPGVSPKLKPRLVHYDGRLIGVNSSSTSLFAIEADFTITHLNTPEPILNQWHVMAPHTSGLYLLTLGSNLYKVYHTTNLVDWTYHSDLPGPVVSITPWTGVGLIISEMGVNARLLKVPFAS